MAASISIFVVFAIIGRLGFCYGLPFFNFNTEILGNKALDKLEKTVSKAGDDANKVVETLGRHINISLDSKHIQELGDCIIDVVKNSTQLLHNDIEQFGNILYDNAENLTDIDVNVNVRVELDDNALSIAIIVSLSVFGSLLLIIACVTMLTFRKNRKAEKLFMVTIADIETAFQPMTLYVNVQQFKKITREHSERYAP